jgi:hypothetical protein
MLKLLVMHWYEKHTPPELTSQLGPVAQSVAA